MDGKLYGWNKRAWIGSLEGMDRELEGSESWLSPWMEGEEVIEFMWNLPAPGWDSLPVTETLG